MKNNLRFLAASVGIHMIAATAIAEGGPVLLDETGLDAVTAGSTNPLLPNHTTAAASALQNLPGFYSPFTSSSNSATLLDPDLAARATAWRQETQTSAESDDETTSSNDGNDATRALAEAGLGSSPTTSGSGSPTSGVNTFPSTGGIDYTGISVGATGGGNAGAAGGAGVTSLTIYSPQAPAGQHLRDFVHHNVQNQW